MTTPSTQAAGLPELPKPARRMRHPEDFNVIVDYFNTDQMRTYARSAISAHEAEVGRLREALEKISNLDPENDSDEGFNEWGEAECFYKAQLIARAALTQGETK
jgi:hypothetical protein